MQRRYSTALASLLFGALALLAGIGPDAHAQPPATEPLECLALNVYWEARAEPEEDQFAVAWVTLNRAAGEGFPDTICAVVYHGGEDERHRCQFSWWCDGKPDVPANAEAWERALAVARQTMAGDVPDPTDGALFFHHESVTPHWAAKKTLTARIGPHRYYK